MNLIEAVNSGRPFRRPCFPEGMYYSYARGTGILTQTLYRSDGFAYCPCREDILADDYELQDVAVSITGREFWQAAEAAFEYKTERAFGHVATYKGRVPPPLFQLQRLAELLGLSSKDAP